MAELIKEKNWIPKHLRRPSFKAYKNNSNAPEWEFVDQKTKDFFLGKMKENQDHVINDSFEENGVWYWTSTIEFKDGPRIIPCDVIEDAGFIVPESHKIAREKRVERDLGKLHEQMKDHEPSEEELYEMRAAFGPGETVVNLITGKETKL